MRSSRLAPRRFSVISGTDFFFWMVLVFLSFTIVDMDFSHWLAMILEHGSFSTNPWLCHRCISERPRQSSQHSCCNSLPPHPPLIYIITTNPTRPPHSHHIPSTFPPFPPFPLLSQPSPTFPAFTHRASRAGFSGFTNIFTTIHHIYTYFHTFSPNFHPLHPKFTQTPPHLPKYDTLPTPPRTMTSLLKISVTETFTCPGKRPDAGHSEEPRTGDDERGLKEGTDLVRTSSRACSKRFSTSSSSDDRSTESTSSAREDESWGCVCCDCEAAAGSRSDRELGKRLSKSWTSVIAFFLPMSLWRDFQCVKLGFFSLKGNTLSTKTTLCLATTSDCFTRMTAPNVFSRWPNPKNTPGSFCASNWTSARSIFSRSEYRSTLAVETQRDQEQHPCRPQRL